MIPKLFPGGSLTLRRSRRLLSDPNVQTSLIVGLMLVGTIVLLLAWP
jgi:hypothetical protein